jgi:tetratricopeptide (TPR) repeat protein
MNKLVIFIAIILVFFATGCRSNRAVNNSLFEKSTKDMANEKYADALTGYQQLESAGVKTPALYTNIGTLYFKTHQLGKSILYFEKGLLVAPLDTELTYNRDKVLSKLTNAVDNNNSSFDSSRETFFKTLDVLNIIVIIDVMICAMLFLFFLLKPAEQTKFYNTKTFRTVLAASVFVLIIISAVVRIYESTKYAVVIAPDATVYLGPSTQAKVLSKFNEGYKLEVTNKFNGWFEIKDFQGKTGWISADKLGEIE